MPRANAYKSKKRKRNSFAASSSSAFPRVVLTPHLQFRDQTIVTVKAVADKDTASFSVYKELLCNYSSVFRERLNPPSGAPGTPDSLTLQASAETFQVFLNWLYTKDLVVDGLDSDSESEDGGEDSAAESADPGASGDANKQASEISVINISDGSQSDNDSITADNGDSQGLWYSGLKERGRVFGRLLELYIFGDVYKIQSFKTAVILEWQEFSTSKETLPCPTIVKRALDYLDLKSPLCQFLILCYGYYTDYFTISKRRFSTLPSTFLTEVLMVTFKRLDKDVKSWEEDWCRFHEHQDEEEKQACEASREEEEQPWRPRGGCC
ncbi:MAG: hypothetical protein M1840_004468 [Geoglossum simile]|nr:MAG: hypothetical protein M1840_004468 [Geoglossum simile]